MDIERDIKDICETLRDEELYTEAMAIKEIIEIQNARIQKLGEENARLRKALEEIQEEYRGSARAAVMNDMATEALKDT